jgi:hypothetical protein
MQGSLLRLVDLWLKHFDRLGTTGQLRRRQVALALVSLLPVDAGMVDRLDDVLGGCGDVDAEPALEGLLEGPAPLPGEPLHAAHLRGLHQADPVAATNLRGLLQQKLGEAQAAHRDAFDRAIATVDPLVLRQFTT